jgi:hypothetical protein
MEASALLDMHGYGVLDSSGYEEGMTGALPTGRITVDAITSQTRYREFAAVKSVTCNC